MSKVLAQGLLTDEVDGIRPRSNWPLKSEHPMDIIQLPVGAIEYSLIYMLGGGGLIGAFVIFIIARMLRR
jgi:hypothetical protein